MDSDEGGLYPSLKRQKVDEEGGGLVDLNQIERKELTIATTASGTMRASTRGSTVRANEMGGGYEVGFFFTTTDEGVVAKMLRKVIWEWDLRLSSFLFLVFRSDKTAVLKTVLHKMLVGYRHCTRLPTLVIWSRQ